MSLQQIADLLGISNQAVSAIEKRALKKIRAIIAGDSKLREYFDGV